MLTFVRRVHFDRQKRSSRHWRDCVSAVARDGERGWSDPIIVMRLAWFYLANLISRGITSRRVRARAREINIEILCGLFLRCRI